MGACATKPKVLKADSGEAPAPAPDHSPEDTAAGGGAAAETKLEDGGDGKATEVVDDDKVDSKSRSLSNLFNDQNNEGKDSIEKEKTEADASEKQDTPSETDKGTKQRPEEKPSETNPPELPPSDSVTNAVEIPSEENTITETKKLEKDPKNEDPIEENIKVEVTNENDPENTESSEKQPETENQVKVISN